MMDYLAFIDWRLLTDIHRLVLHDTAVRELIVFVKE